MTVPTSTEPDVAGPGDEESGSPTTERGDPHWPGSSGLC